MKAIYLILAIVLTTIAATAQKHSFDNYDKGIMYQVIEEIFDSTLINPLCQHTFAVGMNVQNIKGIAAAKNLSYDSLAEGTTEAPSKSNYRFVFYENDTEGINSYISAKFDKMGYCYELTFGIGTSTKEAATKLKDYVVTASRQWRDRYYIDQFGVDVAFRKYSNIKVQMSTWLADSSKDDINMLLISFIDFDAYLHDNMKYLMQK